MSCVSILGMSFGDCSSTSTMNVTNNSIEESNKAISQSAAQLTDNRTLIVQRQKVDIKDCKGKINIGQDLKLDVVTLNDLVNQFSDQDTLKLVESIKKDINNSASSLAEMFQSPAQIKAITDLKDTAIRNVNTETISKVLQEMKAELSGIQDQKVTIDDGEADCNVTQSGAIKQYTKNILKNVFESIRDKDEVREKLDAAKNVLKTESKGFNSIVNTIAKTIGASVQTVYIVIGVVLIALIFGIYKMMTSSETAANITAIGGQLR